VIETGDTVALVGARDGGEPLRLDYVDFTRVEGQADGPLTGDDALVA
jgi:hypothetical protein